MALRWLIFLLLSITLEPSSNSTCVALSKSWKIKSLKHLLNVSIYQHIVITEVMYYLNSGYDT